MLPTMHDHLSRASLADNKEMTDSFQVFALEVETRTPFDSIKVAQERQSPLQKCTAQDLVLETLKKKREKRPVSSANP